MCTGFLDLIWCKKRFRKPAQFVKRWKQNLYAQTALKDAKSS